MNPSLASIPASALYQGTVVHKRLAPLQHGFAYRVFALCLDVDEIDLLAVRCRLFSRNRFNLVSFHDADHGAGTGQHVGEQVRTTLSEAGLAQWSHRIELLCYPRLLGYVFNPLSVYFCHDAGGHLGVVIYEVSNTFGERTSYVIPGDEAGDGTLQQSCAKAMTVSPFTAFRGRYGFHIRPPGDEVLIGVTLRSTESSDSGAANVQGQPILKTHFRGARRTFTDRSLAGAVARHPLMTLKVTTAIHYEAARLWLKGVPLRPRQRSQRHAVALVAARGEATLLSTSTHESS